MQGSDTVGTIFDIQRFSIHDGPGIRTTVFFKGCSLHCFWCHNPESVNRNPELQVFAQSCIGCGACVTLCSTGACTLVGDPLCPSLSFNADLCNNCLRCVDACFAHGLVASGYETTARAVVDEVLRDRAFYADSGGVTLSGGEPVLQTEFAYAILEACYTAGIHTAVETAGNYPREMAARLLPVLDLVMMDLKHMDAHQHRTVTGASNNRILKSARQFALTDKPIRFRTPVIPTVNDSPNDIGAIAQFVKELIRLRKENNVADPISYELLTFHQMAQDKYVSPGRDYHAKSLKPLSKEQMTELNQVCSNIIHEKIETVPMSTGTVKRTTP
ncbi:MAG: glycyl-radical enzyme activating protein [Chloroflexota bacterium]